MRFQDFHVTINVSAHILLPGPDLARQRFVLREVKKGKLGFGCDEQELRQQSSPSNLNSGLDRTHTFLLTTQTDFSLPSTSQTKMASTVLKKSFVDRFL